MSNQTRLSDVEGATIAPFNSGKAPPASKDDLLVHPGMTALGEGRPAGARPSAREIARARRIDNKVEVAIEPAALAGIFGVSDPGTATHLLNQLVRVLHPDPTKPVDAATINHALALIEGITPADALEAMTTTMLVAAQHASLDALRRGSHPDQTPGGRALYLGLALKAMRTYAQLLEAFNHGRGKGVTQQIIVKRYTVEAGAQAVLGSVELDRGRG